jgi:hypothetical protein
VSLSLPAAVLEKLRPLELQLQKAKKDGEVERAIELGTEIQALFDDNRRHFRLLRAKLWVFEAALDADRLAYAESGFIGVRQLCSRDTRLYLEASALLAICLLRQHKIEGAKRLIRDVVNRLNNISSARTRRLFQKRFISRIEEECIFVGLIGTGSGDLDPVSIHEKAVMLIQQNSDHDILKLLGSSIPSDGVMLLRDVREYSIKQLPPPDRKLLPSPSDADKPASIGKVAYALIRRIAWKSLCRPNSEIYKLWSKRVPRVFNQGYFSAALVATLNTWRIGVPLLASGILALVMKETAEAFCEMAKPKGMMIDQTEQNEGTNK